MLYLSASSIKDFLSCSMMYYYRRYRKSEAKVSKYVDIGSIVHSVIEKYPVIREDGLYYGSKLASEFDLDSDSVDRVDYLLKNYYRNYSDKVRFSDKTEYEFSVPYNSNVIIVGKMDRILDGDILVDWKTGTKISKYIDRDPQFIIYDWAYEKVFGRKATDILLVSLYNNEVIKYRRNQNYFDEFFDTLIPKALASIGEEHPVRNGLFRYRSPCYNCFYKEVCFNELDSRNLTS